MTTYPLIQVPFLPLEGPWPVTARVGARRDDLWKDDHKGTDFGSMRDKFGGITRSILAEPFRSVFPGNVQAAGWSYKRDKDGKILRDAAGKAIVDAPGLRVWVLSNVQKHGLIRVGYWHASLLAVAEGADVDAGTQLGLVGNSGNSSAPHLHFQIETWPGRQILAPDLEALKAA